MAVLKAQPPAPSSPSVEARAAVSLLAKFGDRLRSLARATGAYVGKQADIFITEAVKVRQTDRSITVLARNYRSVSRRSPISRTVGWNY